MNLPHPISRWEAPTPQDVGPTVEDFLVQLGNPPFFGFQAWMPRAREP